MKPSILIVDDEQSLCYTFECFLVDAGYNVEVAYSYEEALEKVSKINFDVIFADILLGKKTGLDFLRTLRNNNISCPVIIITGYPTVNTASESVRLGAFDYVTKPVEKETLLHITRKAMEFREIVNEKERYSKNLQAIFRSVKDGIITVNKDLKITGLNDSARHICGLPDDCTGKYFNDETRYCCGECYETINKTIKEQKSFELYRIECHHKYRSRQFVTLNVTPLIDGCDDFCGAVMVIRDETKLYELETELRERHKFHNMIGKNDRMQEIYNLVEKLADIPTTVLITGESGTGKELIAEALHYNGPRRNKPLIKVNCSALPENLLESELFGHVKGAFTGAIRDKAGRFEIADGGTVFLDEIGDTSQGLQVRLLRVLQEMEFERVGDHKPVKVDVRIVAATNQNIENKIKAGTFREDLFYRLKVVEINLPPLRERWDDIPILVEHFIKKFNKKFNMNIKGISKDTHKLFLHYTWPGNVRELEHVIEHAFILSNQPLITVDSLPKDLKNFSKSSVNNRRKLNETLLREALKKSNWKKANAAEILGLSRNTIYRKIKEYNILKEDYS